MTDKQIRWEQTDSPGSKAPADAANAAGKKQRDEKSAAESMHHDGSFGRYMSLKVVKLREQFDAQQLQNAEQKSDIFRGVSIYVNGFTRPSHAELKLLMALHGGRFENYLARDSVTHVVCSNLPDTKIKQLTHERKPIPIVRPEWVVASITSGRLLPTSDFQLETLSRALPQQRRLADFRRHTAEQLPPEQLYPGLVGGQGQQVGGGGAGWENEGQLHHRQQQEERARQQQQEDEDEEGFRQQEEAVGGRGPGDAQAEAREGIRPSKRQRLLPDLTDGEVTEEDRTGGGAPAAAAAGVRVGTRNNNGGGTRGGNMVAWTEAADGAGWVRPDRSHVPGGQVVPPPPSAGWGPSGGVGGGGAPGPGLPGGGGGQGSGPGPPPPLKRPPPPPAAALPLAAQQAAHWTGGQGAGEGAGVVATGPQRPTPGPGPEVAGGGAPGPGAGPISPQGSGPGMGFLAPGVGPGSPPAAAHVLAAELRAASDLARGPPRSTRTDPRFMETFFRSSRLHFIGTWRSRIEALMAEVEGSAPAPAPHNKGTERVILHVDMDCFFASVAALGRPELAGRPLAVCHSNSNRGTGEVSSANYLARSFGVRADMFIAEAKRRCPDLVVMPYEFEKYQEVSEKVYRILMTYSSVVQPISCDEAFLDVTGLTTTTTCHPDTHTGGDVMSPTGPEALAARLRADITRATGCTASAGIGPNMLVARLATKRAKPNGQFRVTRGSVLDFLGDLAVDQLPGVGWSMSSKLEALGITTVRQVWSSSRTLLVKQLGTKLGADLWAHAHGQDERRVEPPKARKSVGAEVNYGIRFDPGPPGQSEAERFVGDLAGEVAGRLAGAGVAGRSLTLKVKRRQEGAPEPAKFMGHGACDNISRSVTLSRFTSDPTLLRTEAVGLLRALAIPPEDLRGLGITVARLDNDPASHTTRNSAQPPAKLQAPPRTAFDASKTPAWLTFFQRKAQQPPPSAPPPSPQQQQQQQPPPPPSPRPHSRSPSPPPPGASSPPAAAPGAATHPPSGMHAVACAGRSRSTSPPPPPAAPAPASPPADVPIWCASMYNEWSDVSVWDRQRQRQPFGGVEDAAAAAGVLAAAPAAPPEDSRHPHQQHQQQRQQRLQLPPRRDAPAPAPVPVAHTATAAAGRNLAGSGPVPPLPAASGGAAQGNVAVRGGAAPAVPPGASAAGGVERPRPRLHPLFAALLPEQPPPQQDAPVGEQQLWEGGIAPDRPDRGGDGGGGGGFLRREGGGEGGAGGDGGRGVGRPREGGEEAVGVSPPHQQHQHQHPPRVSHQSTTAPPPRPASSDTQSTLAATSKGRPRPWPPPPPPTHVPNHTTTSIAAAGPSRPPPPASAMAVMPTTSTASRGVSVMNGRTSGGGGGVRVRPAAADSIDLSMEVDSDSTEEANGRANGRHDGGGGSGGGVRGGRRVTTTRTSSSEGDSVEVVELDSSGEEEDGGGGGVSGAGEGGGGPARRASSGGGGGVNAAEQGRSVEQLPPARPTLSTTTAGGLEGSTASVAASARTVAAVSGGRVGGEGAGGGVGAQTLWAGFLRQAPAAARGGARGAGGGGGRGRGGRSRGAGGSGSGGGGGRGGRGGAGSGGPSGSGPNRGRGSAAAAATAPAAVAAAQIDRSVLVELPPDVRREVEREYGLLPALPPARRPAPPAAATRPAKRSRLGPVDPPPRQQAGPTTNQPPSGQPTVTNDVSLGAVGRGAAVYEHAPPAATGGPSTTGVPDPQPGPSASTDMGAAVPQYDKPGPSGATKPAVVPRSLPPLPPPASGAAAMPTSMADVDLAVLDELPEELRQEITAALRRGGTTGVAAAANAARGTAAAAAARQAPPPPARVDAHTAHGHRAPLAGGRAGPLPPAALGAMPLPGAGRGAADNGVRNADVLDLREVEVVAPLPEDASPQKRMAAAAALMFRPVALATEGGHMGSGALGAAFLRALRHACDRSGSNGRGRGEVRHETVKEAARHQGAIGENGNQNTRPGNGARQVKVTCMVFALWCMSQDHYLEGMVTLLRRARRMVAAGGGDGAGDRKDVQIHLERVVKAVQEHVRHKFGFALTV